MIEHLADNGKQGPKRHIPYRESHLTRLLQPVLGGNSATTIIAAVAPGRSSLGNTKATLQFISVAATVRPVVSSRPERELVSVATANLSSAAARVLPLLMFVWATRMSSGVCQRREVAQHSWSGDTKVQVAMRPLVNIVDDSQSRIRTLEEQVQHLRRELQEKEQRQHAEKEATALRSGSMQAQLQAEVAKNQELVQGKQTLARCAQTPPMMIHACSCFAVQLP